jgi:hypothetical protein
MEKMLKRPTRKFSAGSWVFVDKRFNLDFSCDIILSSKGKREYLSFDKEDVDEIKDLFFD